MAGDWGTGDPSSLLIAEHMKEVKADFTIHLGDVYYSGTEEEEKEKLVDPWPPGRSGSFTLNSNHEMYSHAHGYFNVALADPKFGMQGGASCFALDFGPLLLLGVDTAYFAHWWELYQVGVVADKVADWLKQFADNPNRKIIMLTHHHAIDDNGRMQGSLWKDVEAALGRLPDVWYWAHVHSAAVFNAIPAGNGKVHARCMGHGGIPSTPNPMTPHLAWTEQRYAGDPDVQTRALNGFVVLRISQGGAVVEEQFRDEHGGVAWPPPAGHGDRVI